MRYQPESCVLTGKITVRKSQMFCINPTITAQDEDMLNRDEIVFALGTLTHAYKLRIDTS
jgi:hypothetical protein